MGISPVGLRARRRAREVPYVLREWNRFVPKYNAIVRAQSVGRPLAASDAQQHQVIKLRKAGKSLRGIVGETGLGIRTVRTIIGKTDGTDRTTAHRNELRKIELNRAAMAAYRARKRTRDTLEKRINKLLEGGQALLRRARGS
jgi:hypothetical protein